jgi:hypothetical protein
MEGIAMSSTTIKLSKATYKALFVALRNLIAETNSKAIKPSDRVPIPIWNIIQMPEGYVARREF